MEDFNELQVTLQELNSSVRYLADTIRLLTVKNTIDKKKAAEEAVENKIENTVCYAEVADIMCRVRNMHDTQVVKAILSKHTNGAKRFGDAPESSYQNIYNECVNILKQGEK